MKRLATGILTGAMVLSLGAMTVSASDVATEDAQASSKATMRQEKTERVAFPESFSSETMMEEKLASRGENMDFDAMMEEKLASRGENMDFEM
ncbi:MAG: hypothetical protein R3Y63_14915, partial [Eubacteriales bacterium]